MSRVFAQEDGNLNVLPITTSRVKAFSDIDLTFAAKPSGDVFKKTDAAAVKQALKNLLLTNKGEKPFQPLYGGDLHKYLFELNDVDDDEIQDQIVATCARFEPRVKIMEVITQSKPDVNSITVLVRFRVVNIRETQTLNLSLTRLR